MRSGERGDGGWGGGGLLDKRHVTCGCKMTEPQTTEQTQSTVACSCGNLVNKTVPLDVITLKCSKHNRCVYVCARMSVLRSCVGVKLAVLGSLS